MKLKNHFEKHFNAPMPKDEPHELHQIPEYMKHLQLIATDSINVHIPDKDEIKKALLKLKNGKAANDIPPEFLKYASESESLLCELERLLTTIWRTQSTPTSWSHQKLVALWKGAAKGNVKDPSAYIGLRVDSTLCKLTIIIILDRLKKWYDEQLLDQQQGFRSGRGTADGIFITKRIQQISEGMKKPVYALFIDLSAAFDHINRSWLFKSISLRFPRQSDKITLIKILESIYQNTTSSLAETPDDIIELLALN